MRECYLSVAMNIGGQIKCKIVKITFAEKGRVLDAFCNGLFCAGEIAKDEALKYEDVYVMNVFDSKELAEQDINNYLVSVKKTKEAKLSSFPALECEKVGSGLLA